MNKVTTTITALSHDGRGIANIQGKVTFISGALPGETIELIYTKHQRKFDEARVATILKPAAQRVTPACPHFGVCGGCSLQHIDKEAQLQAKQALLLSHLQHFGGLTPQAILPPVNGAAWHYRHKARLGVKYVAKKATTLVGFREKGSHYLAELSTCEVLAPPAHRLITPLRVMLNQLAGCKIIPQIELAIGEDVTVLIIRHLAPLSLGDQERLCQFGQTHNLVIYLQPGDPDSVRGLWPEAGGIIKPIHYHLPKHRITLAFKPNAFSQVNPTVNRQMVDLAIELLAPKTSDQVLDLYCGFGNFTLPLARYSKHVTGVEGHAGMVAQAQENSQLNQLDNTQFYVSDLTHDNQHTPWAAAHYDKLLLDPPRTGCAPAILSLIGKFKAQKLVYISCNPATLARDAGLLVRESGYQLVKAGILDMFPHTNHVESIALFERG